MSTQQQLYGPHAALLNQCNITVYSNASPDRWMSITHQPTGITVETSGISDIMMKRDLLDELAGKVAEVSTSMPYGCHQYGWNPRVHRPRERFREGFYQVYCSCGWVTNAYHLKAIDAWHEAADHHPEAGVRRAGGGVSVKHQ